jgi:hypothetical protein
MEPIFAPNARVELLNFTQAYKVLRTDLSDTGPCLAFVYLVDVQWFRELFEQHLQQSLLMLIGDSRQRATLRILARQYTKLKAATWSINRTMHDKTLILPQKNIIYLTTNNITRGSWTMSMNSTARIECAEMTKRLEEQFHTLWDSCLPVTPFTIVK